MIGLEKGNGMQATQGLLSVGFPGSWDHQLGGEEERVRLRGRRSWAMVQSKEDFSCLCREL